MTREDAIKELTEDREFLMKSGLDETERGILKALEMAIKALSDMNAISKIRAKLNTEYNNTSGDVQAGIAIALGILDRYTKGGKE